MAGNKMRKLLYMVRQSDAFFANKHLVSFGGSQSNAMLALAQLAYAKRMAFTYFTRELTLKNTSVKGNMALARELGMQVVELQPGAYHELVHTRDFASFVKQKLLLSAGISILCVPQGAAFPEAQDGVKLLAEEINAYVQTQWHEKRFSVVLPSGTGTTALYLAQHLHPEIKLFAIPCVGDAAYLQKQFQQLIGNDVSLQSHSTLLPRVLIPKQKNRFGRLWRPLYDMYQHVLQETKLEFDLLYGAFAWHTLFSDTALLDEVLGRKYRNTNSICGQCHTDREMMYIHTGGTSGNATMVSRYLCNS
ncbi:hypothetical protein CCR75_007073 [Bremia lactucae]|uniref:Tryptophan synthase beta chain-like PALP domain-containing protein n=1 Tax=Bremia lactucae TaxID=4779 RepID=A0A976IKV5_BRELC|nr:hypothetical protein CCR75_007073 [Bremia lactucae]